MPVLDRSTSEERPRDGDRRRTGHAACVEVEPTRAVVVGMLREEEMRGRA